MTAAHDYEDLHHLVDRLTPAQAREMRKHALQLIKDEDSGESGDSNAKVPPQELSFIGIMSSGEGDLSIRHEEILHEEFNRRS